MDNKFFLSFFLLFSIFFPEILSEAMTSDSCAKLILPGKCNGNFVRYGFNSWTLKCEKFIYGGCGQNENNFMTLNACKATCEGICLQERKKGSCKASIPVFGFDAKVGKCVKYDYGGCNGTGNKFTSESLCQSVCQRLFRY